MSGTDEADASDVQPQIPPTPMPADAGIPPQAPPPPAPAPAPVPIEPIPAAAPVIPQAPPPPSAAEYQPPPPVLAPAPIPVAVAPPAPVAPVAGYAYDPTPPPPPLSPAPPAKRRHPALPWIIVLASLLVVAIGGLVYLLVQNGLKNAALDDANDQIDQQQQQIQQQNDMLNQKESFGAAMDQLMQVVAQFDGAPTATVVPVADYQDTADAAWQQRRDTAAVAALTAQIQDDTTALQGVLDAAAQQRATNASGTVGEGVVDRLGQGFATTVYDDAKALCGVDDAIGCVSSDDPTTVHLDAAGFSEPYTDDWGRTYVAEHEFAHVLQFTNPDPTETALDAFGGDVETMADCYALTLSNSWSLSRKVTVGGWVYTVDYGYGQVCNASQRDVIRQWISDIGFRYAPITQQ